MRLFILALALVVVSACVALSETYIRPCYFTNWSHYRPDRGKYVPEDYIPGLCTHILFAFGWIDAQNFTARAYDEQDLPSQWAGDGMFLRVNKLKKSDPGLKTLLSFGGWTFGTDIFKRLAAERAHRETFIHSAIEFVEKWGFDGIDIDWEYPEPGDKDNYLSFISELKEAVVQRSQESGKEQLLVTAAVSPNVHKVDEGYHVAELARLFNFILLMSYDFHGAWERKTGINAPLYAKEGDDFSVDVAAKHWVNLGMPKKMIAIGMPTYGRGWTLDDPSNNGVGAPASSPAQALPYSREAGNGAYYELCDMIQAGAEVHRDEESKTPYIVRGNQWFSYDDEESFGVKLDWVIENGFGGAFTWALDMDDFNGKCAGKHYPLHSVITKKLTGNEVSSVVPTTELPPVVVITTSTEKPLGIFCDGQPDGFQSHPKSCESFLLCLKNQAHEMKCPYGLEFSSTLSHCTFPYKAQCARTEPPSTVTRPPSRHTTKKPFAFACQEDGFFSDPESCFRFYRCAGGVAYHFDCAGGLHFNPKTELCDHPIAVNCQL